MRCELVAGYSSEVLLGAEISTNTTTTLDNHVTTSSYTSEKTLKETPI